MADVGRVNNLIAMFGNSVKHRCRSKKTKLALPPEILELIFWHMDESTFFISLRTCRQFAEAGSTRKNLLHQIRRIPGLRPGLEDLGKEGLRHACYRRAATSGCMAWVLADIRRCNLPLGTILSKSAFSANTSIEAGWNRTQNSRLALANKNGTITIYSLADDDVKPVLTLDLRNPHDQDCSMLISALAFSRKGDLVVLHEQGEEIGVPERKGENHRDIPGFGLPHMRRTRKIYEMTTFYRCCYDRERHNKHGQPISCHNGRRRSRILALEGAKPIGIALACTGNASIAWEVKNRKDGWCHRIELIRTSKRPAEDGVSASGNIQDDCDMTYSQNTSTTFDPFSGHLVPCNFIRLKFVDNDHKLLIHNSAIPVCDRFKDCGRGTEEVGWNSIYHDVRTDGPLTPTSIFNVGTLFHGIHSSDVTIAGRTDLVCVNSYLALGLPDPYYEESEEGMQYLFVLLYEDIINTAICKHSVRLDRLYPRVEWTPVALLAGWRPNNGTMGSLIEISPRGTRIASAAWDRVLVWTIDPEQLHQGDLAHYFPPRDYNAQKGYGRIRPILLPPQGIVHAMKWINDKVLYALTDKGLVSWNVGPRASGKRRIDAATDEALTV